MDVCLALVIIFMAVAPMAVTLGIKVLETRSSNAEGKASVDENVSIRLIRPLYERCRSSLNGACSLSSNGVTIPILLDEMVKERRIMFLPESPDAGKITPGGYLTEAEEAPESADVAPIVAALTRARKTLVQITSTLADAANRSAASERPGALDEDDLRNIAKASQFVDKALEIAALPDEYLAGGN